MNRKVTYSSEFIQFGCDICKEYFPINEEAPSKMEGLHVATLNYQVEKDNPWYCGYIFNNEYSFHKKCLDKIVDV